MRALVALSLVATLSVAAPRASAAPRNAPVAAAQAKRTVGMKLKAGWRKIGLVGRSLAVATVAGGAAYGMNYMGFSPVETGAVITGVGATAVGGIAIVAQRAKKLWTGSLAALKLNAIDHAQADSAELPKVLDELRHASAEAKAPTTNKQQAQVKARDGAFLDLAIVRGELALDNASDPKVRSSGITLESWTHQVSELEQAARARVTSTSEGRLALALRDVGAEVQKEEGMVARETEAITRFEDHVPIAFGGVMAKEATTAKTQVKKLVDGELAGERSLHQAKTAAMRGRVSDRVAGERPEFLKRRTRFRDLNALSEGLLGDTVNSARRAHSEMSSAKSDLTTQALYEVQALAHTADTESYTADDGKPQTRTVDNSGTYRTMAASSAASAATHVAEANTQFKQLSKGLKALSTDPTMAKEQLLSPQHQGEVSDSGPGIAQQLFMPEVFNLFGTLSASSGLSTAQDKLAPKLKALESLASVVSTREHTEKTWVETQIDDDLGRQMTAAAP